MSAVVSHHHTNINLLSKNTPKTFFKTNETITKLHLVHVPKATWYVVTSIVPRKHRHFAEVWRQAPSAHSLSKLVEPDFPSLLHPFNSCGWGRKRKMGISYAYSTLNRKENWERGSEKAGGGRCSFGALVTRSSSARTYTCVAEPVLGHLEQLVQSVSVVALPSGDAHNHASLAAALPMNKKAMSRIHWRGRISRD